MADLLDVILPVFLVIAFGWIVVKRGLFSDDGVDALMRFTQNFAIPCLLFRAISTLELTEYFEPRLLFSFYGPAIAMFAVGLFGARVMFGRPWEHCVAIGFACLFSNSVLLGLPIMERAYGADSLDPNFALIAINAPLCYFIGITTMEVVRALNSASSPGVIQTLRRIADAMFRNALVLAILLGFAVNLSGITLPGVAADALDMMVRAALPAALFGLGGVLARYRIEGDTGPVALICVLMLLVQPALTWALGRQMALDPGAFRSAVLTAAMAPGVNIYVFANMYGVAKRVVASTVLVATGASILTLWLWLAILPSHEHF